MTKSHFTLNKALQGFTILDVYIFLAASLFIWVVFTVLEPHVSSKKGKSWIVMLQTSAILSGFGIHAYLTTEQSGLWKLDHVYDESLISRCVVLFFVSANVMDLFLGVLYYPSFLDPLTTIFHHIFYLVFMAVLLKCNYSRGFLLCFFMEIPTFILALGSAFKELRSDLSFGVSFLITRVIYNAYLAFRLYCLSPEGKIYTTI